MKSGTNHMSSSGQILYLSNTHAFKTAASVAVDSSLADSEVPNGKSLLNDSCGQLGSYFDRFGHQFY